MAKKFSQKEWIQKAKSIWKNTYDYKKVKYINSKTKVQLICKVKKHGSFWTLPSNHTGNKYGCPKCGKLKYIKSLTKTFETFKKEAKEIHHKKYTYDNTSYKSARVKTKIICKIHGEFWQTPDAHINGKQGCKKCKEDNYSLRSKINTISQISKLLKEKYKDSLSLKKNTYQGIHKEAIFSCIKHGKFKRIVSSVIYPKNHPCKKCGLYLGDVYFRDNSLIEELIQRQFGKKYKVLPFNLKNKKTRLRLVCKKHGTFFITIGSLRNAKGCPKCLFKLSQNARTEGLRRKNLSTANKRYENWLKKAKAKHGNYFDYSKVKYLSSTKSVKIICPNHGLFNQIPHTHLTSGCRKCADEDLKGMYSEWYFKKYPEKKSITGLLYYLKIQSKSLIFYKVGITIQDTRKRFAIINKKKFKINIIAEKKDKIYSCFKKEKIILISHGYKYRYTPRIKNFTGHSECFTKPISKKIYGKIFN